jgi:hypothetical protein
MDELLYRRRLFAWGVGAGFGVFLLIGVSGLITQPVGGGPFLFFVALTLLSAALVLRSVRMATIIARGDSVTIRGFLRSKRLPVNVIRAIEALEMPNMYGMAGRTIAVRTVDGHKIVVGEFWMGTRRSVAANRIDTIVRELNEWCRMQRRMAISDIAER